MEEEIQGIVGNLGRVISECACVASGFFLMLLSYSIFGCPSFKDFSIKALCALKFITGNVFMFLVFILFSYFIGFVLPVVFKIIPVSKNRKLFDSREAAMNFDDFFKILQFLQKEGNKKILQYHDGICHYLDTARIVGSTLVVTALILLIASALSFSWIFIALLLLSTSAAKLMDVFSKKAMEDLNSLMQSSTSFVQDGNSRL